MLPALLITFREVIEATLIVATILGILVKVKLNQGIRTVWWATLLALVLSIFLLVVGSFMGYKVHELFQGRIEQVFEGTMMVISAVFISWAIFWLHRYFGRYKLTLLLQVKKTAVQDSQRGLFFLVFTAVFREGIEIVLFLSTIYFSANPTAVFMGFGLGVIFALLTCASLFTASLKLPIYRTFQGTTVLLVLFAAGLAGRGVQEFIAAGIIPKYLEVNLGFLPAKGNLVGDLVKAIFGWSKTMDFLQLAVYAAYITLMRWYLYGRKSTVLFNSGI